MAPIPHGFEARGAVQRASTQYLSQPLLGLRVLYLSQNQYLTVSYLLLFPYLLVLETDEKLSDIKVRL